MRLQTKQIVLINPPFEISDPKPPRIIHSTTIMLRITARHARQVMRPRAMSTVPNRSMKFATLATAGGLAVGAAFAYYADAAEPKLLDSSKVESTPVNLLTEEDLEPEPQGAYNPETGEINWDCPCLGGMANGPCGEEFKTAFSCFVYSTEEPKGKECIEAFSFMQDCFRKHPEVYAEQLGDDDDNEAAAEVATAKEQELTVVDNVDKAGLAVEKKVGETSEKVVATVNQVEDAAQTQAAAAVEKVEIAVEAAAEKAKQGAAAAVSKLTPDAKNESRDAAHQAHEFREKVDYRTAETEDRLSNFAHEVAKDIGVVKDKFERRNEETARNVNNVTGELAGDSHHASNSAGRSGDAEAQHLHSDMNTFSNKVAHRLEDTADKLKNLGK